MDSEPPTGWEHCEKTGAWLQLRDALDYADSERFPVAQFGELAPFFNFPYESQPLGLTN